MKEEGSNLTYECYICAETDTALRQVNINTLFTSIKEHQIKRVTMSIISCVNQCTDYAKPNTSTNADGVNSGIGKW